MLFSQVKAVFGADDHLEVVLGEWRWFWGRDLFSTLDFFLSRERGCLLLHLRSVSWPSSYIY